MDWQTLLGYFSLLSFIVPDLEGTVLVRTVLTVHICDAVLCHLIAGNSGRDKGLWTVGGLLLGIWALGVLLFFPKWQPKTGGHSQLFSRLQR
jgi:hypothetical protein